MYAQPELGSACVFGFFSFLKGSFPSLLSKLIFKISTELSSRLKKNRYKPSPLQLGHTVELIVVAASEALRERVILNLQLCNLGTEIQRCLTFLFFLLFRCKNHTTKRKDPCTRHPLCKTRLLLTDRKEVYYPSEALQTLKAAWMKPRTVNIPQQLTLAAERTLSTPADTE